MVLLKVTKSRVDFFCTYTHTIKFNFDTTQMMMLIKYLFNIINNGLKRRREKFVSVEIIQLYVALFEIDWIC